MRLSALALFRIHQRSQLAGKKNGVVGVITSETISDPFYGYFNDRLMKGFQKYGYDVIYAVAQNTKAGATEKSQCFMEKWMHTLS